MLVWCMPTLCFTAVVLLIDFIARRKKWNENTKAEKNGLILSFVVAFPYIFCSIYGRLMGIVGPQGHNPFTEMVYEVLLVVGKGTIFVCLAATIASLVLRWRGKAVASNRVLLFGLLYCAVLMAVSILIFG